FRGRRHRGAHRARRRTPERAAHPHQRLAAQRRAGVAPVRYVPAPRGDLVRRRAPGTAREGWRHWAAPRQLRVFDDPSRDDRGWVLSAAHRDAVPAHRIAASERTAVVAVDDLPPLAYDHGAIVAAAVEALRAEYQLAPDCAGLLTAPNLDGEPAGSFTIRDLRLLHERVCGERLVADTFRRQMLLHLRPTGVLRRGVRGKPAELYVRSGD